MKHFLFLIFAFFIISVSGQNNTSFEDFVASYNNAIYKNNADALQYALQAKRTAEANNNNEQAAEASYYAANCYYHLGEQKNALEYVETAIAKSTTSQDTVFLYNCYSLQGRILSELGEDSKALRAHLQAGEYAKEIPNPDYEISTISNIAHIKKLHKDFKEAITMYTDLLQRLDTLKQTPYIKTSKVIALLDIADIYLWLKKPNEAAFYNDQGLTISKEENFEWLRNPLLMNKAIIFYQNEKYEDCISLSQEIAEKTADDDDLKVHLTALFYLGKSYYKRNAYEKAIEQLNNVLKAMKTTEGVDVNEKELHEFLALLYNKVGNSEKNLYHFQRYAELEKKQSAEDLKINNETHELVDLVSVKSEIQEIKDDLAAQTETKKKWLFVSIVLLIFLIGSIIYYKRKGRITKRKFEELLQKVAILEAEEAEKAVAVPKKEKVTDEKATVILEKIEAFEKRERYLLQECSLGYMANQLDTNTSYLSKVINTYKEKSFTAYITELRINTALIRLKNDKTLRSYTIKAIAEEFGFKRQETFSKAFKSQTGIYPSQYLKKLREK